MTIKKESLVAIADALREEGIKGKLTVPDGIIKAIHEVANKPSDNAAETKLKTVANLFTASQFEKLKTEIKDILEEYRG